MYLKFAWRYFKAKKSANAINIISWVTAGVIAFATCCQILVLSVFNGFEGLVKSLYSSFYTDLKVTPAAGKTFTLDSAQIQRLKNQPGLELISCSIEEKALLQNGTAQTVVQLKGVDENYRSINNVSSSLSNGSFDLGTAENPKLVVGSGIEYAIGINFNPALGSEPLTVILPKANVESNDPLASLSEGFVSPGGSFSIQQDFDNSYALTNIDFVKQQMAMPANRYSCLEIKLKKGAQPDEIKRSLQKLLGNQFVVQNRYEQNANLYQTMKMEKWAIYAVLTLILIIAAFNMISALTMLVLEKKQDISILQSMGSANSLIRKIFLTEGMLLGIIGSGLGILVAVSICFFQLKFKWIKLQGGSFLIDYFPVKMIFTDFLMVAGTALTITFIASWLPAQKASRQPVSLR